MSVKLKGSATCFTCAGILLLTSMVARSPALPLVQPDEPVTALIGATIHTQTDQGVIQGTMLIQGDKIVGVGKDLKIPADARRIDITGMTVTPGWIDARSALWLTQAAAGEGASDGGLNALDGVDPFAEDWVEVVRHGVTAVYVQPAASGNLGGAGVVLRVAPAKSADDLVIKSDAGAQASLGLSGKSANSRERFAQYEAIKKALDAAKKYGEDWEKYRSAEKKPASKSDDTKTKKAKKNSPAKETESQRSKSPAKSTTSSSASKKPKTDRKKDFLLKVLHREVPLRIEAHRSDDIANALKLADDFDIRIVLEGLSHPRASRPALVRERLPMVLGPVIDTEDSPSYREKRRDDWLSSLVANQPRWALATFGRHPRASRFLRVQAAAAVAQGVERARVLRAVTSDAAAILGLENQLGAIAKGMHADLVVFAGDPLDPAVPVHLAFSHGSMVYEAEVTVRPPREPGAPVDGLARLPDVYAIRSKNVLTPDGDFIPRTLVIRAGRLDAIKSHDSVPSDVQVFDVESAPITPGFVVAHSDLGVENAAREPADADASQIRATDVFHPDSKLHRKMMRNGFLRVAFAPSSSSVVAGCVGHVRLGAKHPVVSEEIAGKFVLTSSSRSSNRFPASLVGQVDLVRQSLAQRPVKSQLYLPDPVGEALLVERKRHAAAVRERECVAMFEAATETEIRSALEVIRSLKLRAAILGPEEFNPLIPEIKRLGVGLIVRPIRSKDYNRYLDDLVAAAAAGVPVGLGSGTPEDLRQTAALLVNAGMTREAALVALTSGGAKIAGMAAGAATLDPGQPADFVVWDGSPLNLASQPINVVVDGKLMSDSN